MEATITVIITVMTAEMVELVNGTAVRAESSRVLLSDFKACLWHHLAGSLDKGINFLVSHF